MNKYNPQISDKDRELYNAIKNKAYNIAIVKNMDCVPRELSLFILMERSEKLIRKLSGTGVDSFAFYQQLYAKYYEIDFGNKAKEKEFGQGDEWQVLLEADNNTNAKGIMPDIDFLSSLYKNLANAGKKHSHETVLWVTFQEAISDSYCLPKDDRDDYVTDLMNKYLINPETRNLYFSESYQLALENNANDLVNALNAPGEEEIEQPKKRWWPKISIRLNW